MSHAFKEYLCILLEIFMENLCVHTHKWEHHVPQLQQVLDKYRVYRICLNPNKCKFVVRQGRILGHLVSTNGIATDEENIKVILELPRPKDYKGL